jgi:hypothetical protein
MLDKKLSDLDMKLKGRDLVSTPITPMANKLTDMNSFGIKSFTNFNADFNFKNKSNSKVETDLDFFKKKCSVLEENIKELTQKYTIEMVDLKNKFFENKFANNFDTLNSQNNYELKTPNSVIKKKKTLTPLYSSKNSNFY